MFGQSARWTVTPRPRVTKPTISSGGTGWQQRASWVSSESTPTTRILPFSCSEVFLGAAGSSFSSSCGFFCGRGAKTFSIAFWPSSSFPAAKHRSSTVLKPKRLAKSSSLTAVLPKRAKSLSIFSRPAVSACSISWALNHWRTFVRDLGEAVKPKSGFNQSRLGAPTLAAIISTVWPLWSLVFSGTITPSTLAPRQRWPSSVCRR